MTTADPPKIIGTDNLSVVDYWRARAETLEAELAQSQAEVERLKRALAFISIRSGAQAKGNASSPHTTTTLSPPR